MKKTVFILFVLSLVGVILCGGCAYSGSAVSEWVGRTASELVAARGEPDSTMCLEDGSKVLMWTDFQSPSQIIGSRESFTISADGVVEKFSSSGSPVEPIIPPDKDYRNKFLPWN